MSYNDDNIDDYKPLFELGLYKEDNPACRVISSDVAICPVTLAALTLGLFETVINSVQECDQNEFEKQFVKAFKFMLKKRFEFDLSRKYFDE